MLRLIRTPQVIAETVRLVRSEVPRIAEADIIAAIDWFWTRTRQSTSKLVERYFLSRARLRLMRAVKRLFDLDGRMNPGKVLVS